MTVKELIRCLGELPEDTVVVTRSTLIDGAEEYFELRNILFIQRNLMYYSEDEQWSAIEDNRIVERLTKAISYVEIP